jgi:hypothetical protein
MQDALQQVFREKDAAFREKDTENSFSETPLEAKAVAERQIMVLVTQVVTCHDTCPLRTRYGSNGSSWSNQVSSALVLLGLRFIVAS